MRELGWRVLHIVLLLVAVSFLTFFAMELLPGNPAQTIAGPDAPPERVEAIEQQYGLDRPALERYADWVGGVVHGDFGESYRTGEDAFAAIPRRLGITAQIVLAAQFIALAGAMPLALMAAMHPGSRRDRWSERALFALLSVPHFVLAFALIYIFSLRLGWLPSSGFVTPGDGLWASAKATVLPAVALGLAELAAYQRVLRGDLLNVLGDPHVEFARAKGLSQRGVTFRHALRPASVTLVTLAGANMGRLVGAAVVVESLLAIPGLGRLMVDAVYQRDIVIVQTGVLVIAVIYIASNALVDVLYRVIDPRGRAA